MQLDDTSKKPKYAEHKALCRTTAVLLVTYWGQKRWEVTEYKYFVNVFK